MKSLTFLGILLLGMCVLASHSDAAEQSWEEFIKMKQQVETPKLIPKGGAKPRLLRKDLVIEEIRRTGEFNTGATEGGKPGKLDITSEALLFEYGLPQLRDIPENLQNLKTIAKAMLELGQEYPHYYVDGHTCDIGSDENNCRLSWARSKTVYDRLIAEGVNPQALTMRGFGENPNTTARPNTSEENRQLNRRVVLIAYGKGAGAEWSGKTSRSTRSGTTKQVKGLTPKRPGKDIDVEEAPVGRGRDKEQFMCSAGSYGGIRQEGISGAGTRTEPFVREDVAGVSSDEDELPDFESSLPGIGTGSSDTWDEKGKSKGRLKKTKQSPGETGIPAGFKPLNHPSPKSGEQSSQPQKSKEGIPRGFKASE